MYGTIITETPRSIFPDKHILTSYNSVSSFRGRTEGPWSKIITVIFLILYCLDVGEVLLSFFFFFIRSNKLWTSYCYDVTEGRGEENPFMLARPKICTLWWRQLVYIFCLREKEIDKEREGGGCLETLSGWDERMPTLEALQRMAALACNDSETIIGDVFHKALGAGRQVLG